jgi:hypothetical protein
MTPLPRQLLDKAEARAARVDYRDARLKGLVLRVMPTGVKSWSCEFACGQRTFLGRADVLGLSEARARARATLAVVYLGIDPIDARKPHMPVPNLAAFLEGDYAT